MLKFDRQGLLPVVVQDDATNEVLMVAFMNEEALRLTRETGQSHFYSRSRNKIWHKGEQSGNVQEVRGIFFNCEENSLLLRVVQHGGAACHDGYKSCYYRRLLPDDSYEIVAERIFDPALVYQTTATETGKKDIQKEQSGAMTTTTELEQQLEHKLRQLYGAYLYLRDHDLSGESNTSRLLQEKSHSYLVSRLADELQELAGVQSGEHVHSGREADTILEGSQVGYWLFLLASTHNVLLQDLKPHQAIIQGYTGQYSDDVPRIPRDNDAPASSSAQSRGEEASVELRQECLNQLASEAPGQIIKGLQFGFTFVGWACAAAGISPLAPIEYDLEQMRRKGLVS